VPGLLTGMADSAVDTLRGLGLQETGTIRGGMKFWATRRPASGAPFFHGTSNIAAVIDVLKRGFKVGAGAAKGYGVYLTSDFDVAREYSRGGFVIQVTATNYETVDGGNFLIRTDKSWLGMYLVPAKQPVVVGVYH